MEASKGNKEPVFTVVMPVYNAEGYLKKALQSILDQKFPDFELIVVNDGSLDGSLDVCEAVASTDSRIIVLNNDTNCGAAAARNRGIDIARGKFLCFADADDYIEPDFLSRFYDALDADDCDYIKCGAYEDYYDTNGNVIYTKSCILSDKTVFGEKAVADEVLEMALIPLFGYNVNSCYKMSVVQGNNIRFDETMRVHEDFVFNMAYLPFVRNMRCLSYCGYHYCKRNANSLSYQKENYNLDMQLLKVRSFLCLFKKHRNETQENLDKIYWMFTRNIFSTLESGVLLDTVRTEPVFASYKNHCFGPLAFKKKVLTGILQSDNSLLIKPVVGVMRFVKRYLPVVFAKVKQ